jgi:hypothetical protein
MGTMAKKPKVSKKPKLNRVFEFKVSLVGTKPLVWRSFLAHEIIHLDELHMLIQVGVGWEAKHLYQFHINGVTYSAGEDLGENVQPAEGVLLSDVLGSKKKFTYTYDFGDDWEHDVEIVRALEHDSRVRYPICTGGENACPPEDCGGIHGFEELKKKIAGKDSEEKAEMLGWLGGYYNPITFDPNFVNRHFLWADFE